MVRTSIIIMVLLSGIFLFPPSAHAIIVLPALLLIPIAHIIGVVIAALSVPAIAVGVLVGKLWKKPMGKAVFISLGVLILVGIIVAIILKLANPGRPLF